MADPLSIFAIAGLVYAGRKLSKSSDEQYTLQAAQIADQVDVRPESNRNVTIDDDFLGQTSPLVESEYMSKTEVSSFGDISQQGRSSGGEVLEMRNRMYDGGIMNNLSPIERTNVGPALGVGPNVPAIGGHHQLLRINPENVGAYRLTTLPGRSGPAFDGKGGRRGIAGELGHNRPEKTAYLPDRLPNTGGRAQGFPVEQCEMNMKEQKEQQTDQKLVLEQIHFLQHQQKEQFRHLLELLNQLETKRMVTWKLTNTKITQHQVFINSATVT